MCTAGGYTLQGEKVLTLVRFYLRAADADVPSPGLNVEASGGPPNTEREAGVNQRADAGERSPSPSAATTGVFIRAVCSELL